MKRGELIFNVLRVPADAVMLAFAGVAIYALRTRVLDAWRPVQFAVELPFSAFALFGAVVAVLFVLVYAIAGLYSMQLRMSMVQEAARVAVASSGAMMLVILAIFLSAELFNSRFLVIGYWWAAMTAVIVGRVALRLLYRRVMVRSGAGAHRVLLIGSDGVTAQLMQTIQGEPWLGYRITGVLAHPQVEQVAEYIASTPVDEVILADPEVAGNQIVPLVQYCHEHHLVFRFVPNLYQTLTTNYAVDSVGRLPLIELRRTALDGWGRVFKRIFDIIFSVCALAALSPLFAIIAFAIKWETYGPVFVRLPRVSRNRHFKLLKFRGMIAVDADGSAESLKAALIERNEREGPLFKIKDDPRVTRVGKVIRKYRLDELPQFWNVLKGEMSVIGPRPHQPDEIARYERHHKKVLAIKAGASGMAQVSGSSDLAFEEEVALDTFYIENWSLALDLRIVVRTVLKMFIDRSAV